MMNINPYFSICVPTRNRHETLEFCIKTLLQQNFDDYEIIISDNSDKEDDNTNILIKKFNSEKIKYYRQDLVLSMTDNYEFAVGKASGEYVICIGDDDGLIVDVLNELYEFIRMYNARVIKCPNVSYTWKDNKISKYSTISYPKPAPIAEFSSKSVLAKVFSLELHYFHLPMIYYGAIHKSIIEKIKSIQGSLFSNAAAIDMYSGMCVSYLEDKFYIPDFPFTIAGLSKKSNGSNHHRKNKEANNRISLEFEKLGKLDEEYKKFNVPKINHLTESITWLCLNQFKYNFKIPDTDFKINEENYFFKLNTIDDININYKLDTEIKSEFNNKKYSDIWIENVMRKIGKEVSYFPASIGFNANYYDRHIKLDALLFNVENVYDASILCKEIKTKNLTSDVILLDRKNYKRYVLSNVLKDFKAFIMNLFNSLKRV